MSPINTIPVADLHCDLLSYLARKDGRKATNEESRCSLQQMQEGNVFLQILAIYTETATDSVALGEKQFTIFRTLPSLYPNEFEHFTSFRIPPLGKKVYIAAAIENASSLSVEGERLENAFSRMDLYSSTAGPILYLGLTWHSENRFGGGNMTKIGLKRDGELFLEYINNKQIAIDLSHTSDELAYDIINHIDKKGFDIIPIASHSNFRAISNQPRNLPDDIAKEIFRRGGVVGINFVKDFIGKQALEGFSNNIDYAKFLGGADNLCFGADFFCEKDMPILFQPFFSGFFSKFSNSSCYPSLLQTLSNSLSMKELEKIAHINLKNFLSRLWK